MVAPARWVVGWLVLVLVLVRLVGRLMVGNGQLPGPGELVNQSMAVLVDRLAGFGLAGLGIVCWLRLVLVEVLVGRPSLDYQQSVHLLRLWQWD